ncbi:MAG: hypothetical protein GY791_07980 [Alphaproteobacteria bacterium]|nr:hypothetical protein [Alphaproteobacteria bacterium]
MEGLIWPAQNLSAPAQRFSDLYLRSVPLPHLADNLAGAVAALAEGGDRKDPADTIRGLELGPGWQGVPSGRSDALKNVDVGDPRSAQFLTGYARVKMEQGCWSDAVRALGKARRMAPNEAWIHNTYGYLHLFQEMRPAAGKAFRRAQHLDPRGKQGRAGLRAMEAMKFSFPAERHAIGPLRRARRVADERLNLVFFFAGPWRAPSHGLDLRTLMGPVFDLARRHCPGARIILLTDETTELSGDLPIDRIIRQPLDLRFGIYERMRAQHDYLCSSARDADTAFLDLDVVLNRDLRPIFENEFDIALTYRRWPYPQHPFNAGVIFARRGAQAAAFFEAALACYRSIIRPRRGRNREHGDLREWWGDQLALGALIDWRFFAANGPNAISVNGATVGFFPCRSHNFTPLGEVDLDPDRLSEVFLLHFKGDSRPLLPRFLKACAPNT